MSCTSGCNRTEMNSLLLGSLSYIALQYATKYGGLNEHKSKEKMMRTGVFAAVSFGYDSMIKEPMWTNEQLELMLSSCSKCISRDATIVIAEILRDYLMKGAEHKISVKDVLNEIICVFGADWLEHKMLEMQKKKSNY